LKVERAFEPQRIRDLFVGNYIVRYLIGDGEIVVLRIWHGKENEKYL
ncbi:MAG: type II toxin-antitoxin system RelE/ParE family toxin, partial [Aestuariibacter sp.]|nr:type II toxin-antitoxin system RelE/ParE family toxin [Aestuariibacter sp.]